MTVFIILIAIAYGIFKLTASSCEWSGGSSLTLF